MILPGAPYACPRRYRASQVAQCPRGLERYLLHRSRWLRLAAIPLHQRGDGPPDGKAFGSLMRVFRRFHVGILGGCTRHCRPSYYPRCGTGGTDQSRHLGKEDRKGVDAQRASGSGTWLPTPWWCVSRAMLRELQLTMLQSVQKVTDLPLGGEGGYYFL